MNYTNSNEHIEFIVSLDYHLEAFSDFECLEWGELYQELGQYGNSPLILNGDTDFDSNGEYDHYIWNMFAGSSYSSYAIIDHNMIVRHLFDEPNLHDFQYIYLPTLVDKMYGCMDIDAINYDQNSVYENNTCIYSDLNQDENTDINDIIFLLNMILYSQLEEYADINEDENIDILDIIQLVNIVLNN